MKTSPELELLGRDSILALEPQIKAVAAIHSPASGVVDSHNLMAALEGDAENAGAIIAYQSSFMLRGKKRGLCRTHCFAR